MQFSEEVILELIKAGLAIVALFLGYIFGQGIVASWDIRKKRQELDIEAARQFHKLYGEFKELSRLWRAYKYDPGETGKKLKYPNCTPVELLKRAAAAEGGVEAIIAKLATETERNLEPEHIRTLGLFRQAYQKLREAIREDKPFEWTYPTAEFSLYNKLADKTTHIIANPSKIRWWRKLWRRRHKSDEPNDILLKIAKIRPDDWEEAVKKEREELEELEKEREEREKELNLHTSGKKN